MAFKSYRQESKTDWGTNDNSSQLTLDQINSGALLRIADATELMASNYTQLQAEAEKYKRWYKEQYEDGKRMAKRISTLQGVITRMKKKLK